MLRPRDLYEVYKATPVDEIFKRFSHNPNPIKLFKSVKDTAVALYYAARDIELKTKGKYKLSEAYYSRGSELLDTWEWLGFKRKK